MLLANYKNYTISHKFGIIMIDFLNVFEKHLSFSLGLHLFNKKYNIVKYYFE